MTPEQSSAEFVSWAEWWGRGNWRLTRLNPWIECPKPPGLNGKVGLGPQYHWARLWRWYPPPWNQLKHSRWLDWRNASNLELYLLASPTRYRWLHSKQKR